ncbi:diaminopimelate decarboxylase [Alphaproteobacteria bacterium]|nr:diaminopimelate decarboxylase [Alphaproteobacteria bacterium]MDC0131421.1 diaminopimelate decarboxylase [Alphaproteobacteria bacterium]MDC1241174.1 diaminopimelate decarboxylase [bacterium]
MDHFEYREATLFAEGVRVADIAAEVGTPFYCYSSATLRHHYKVLSDAFREAGLPDTLICYSVKANSNLAVIGTLAQQGAGADIVSQGELIRALKAGVSPSKIVFSGVGKTANEMRAALKAGIAQFNVESLSEIDMLAGVAQELSMTATIALRVNPDVDAGTHEKISTGLAENKFGIAWEDAEAAFAHAASLDGIIATGIDIHIGSQITSLQPFQTAFEKTAELLERLRAAGHTIDRLDLGGGLGVPYQRDLENPPNPVAYARLIGDIFGASGCQIILEPGRLIAANAGILVSSVIRSKRGRAKNFLIVDAAMTELLRPTLYGAHHDIAPIKEAQLNGELEQWDIVGPVCESGDYLGLDRPMTELETGDLLALFTAGAYGSVLGSNYNTRPDAPEVLVDGERFEVVRQRPDYEDMLRTESLPDWLS